VRALEHKIGACEHHTDPRALLLGVERRHHAPALGQEGLAPSSLTLRTLPARFSDPPDAEPGGRGVAHTGCGRLAPNTQGTFGNLQASLLGSSKNLWSDVLRHIASQLAAAAIVDRPLWLFPCSWESLDFPELITAWSLAERALAGRQEGASHTRA
jgi:hypothetical protein